MFNTQGLPLDFRRRIILALSLKQAIEEELEDETLPSVSKMRDSVRLISGRAYRVLFKEFKSRLMPFFDLYGLLHAHSLGEAPAPPEGFSEAFRGYSRLVFTSLRSPEAENEFSALASRLRPMLNRIDSGASDHALAVRVGQVYAHLIQTVTQDRGIYLTLKPSGRWFFLRMMGDKEQQIERLKKEDPELYDTLQKSKEVSKTLDREVEKAIAGAGMIPSRKWIMGRPAHIGADPVTKEEVVFTEDGAVTPVDDYVAKRKQNLRAQREQERVFPEDLDQLRKVSDSEIDQVASQPVTYMALTDDAAKSSAVTRIYPVKKINGNDVVVDGRFKGFLVPDLVNAAGRLIEGVAYDFDPKLGRPIPIETKNRDGSINIRSLQREPYVTVSQGKLMLRIPSVGAYTTHRNRIAELQKLIPSMKYIEHSRKSLYTFEPKDFSAVRNALGGLSFSTAAMKLIRAYFVELAKHELATSNENLKNYEAEAIGGFRQNTKLLTKQKESLAWMESRGNSGVIALDTGVGKTLTALAAIQKMRRDGSAEARFLYVCPPTLRGNLIKEAYQFIEDPKAFLKQVDIMSYRQFTTETQKNPELGKQYEAIFFDEAHELKNPTSDQTKAAMSMKHPRKVLMTASPMERSPMEVFTLAAIADNIDLNTPEGRVAIRAFRKRFAEEVGGRIVGIKDDPTTLRDMRVWVRKSLFFADKRTVEEFVLPKLTKTTDTVTMDAEVEAKYRETASGISDVLRGLTLKYRDREISPETQNKALETARIKLADLFSKLTKLSNLPEKVVPGARNHKLDRLVQIMDQKAGSMSRVVVFTDSPELAQAATDKLVERCPWTSHALALAGKIEIFKAGGSHDTYTKREYKDSEGNKIPAKDWQLYIMKTLVAGDHSVGSVTLTSAYSVGQNLQEFDTVIHLDRDTWNSETIKQRTARLWRQGQDKPVGFSAHEHVTKYAEKHRLWKEFHNLTDKAQDLLGKARKQMGTLGGGNHFIEVCLDTEQHVWLMLHSGSRNIGKTLAEVHIGKAMKLTHNATLPDKDLAVFLAGTPEMDRYRHDLMWAQQYAKANREVMLLLVQDVIKGLFPKVVFEDAIACHHNYVSEENHFGEDVLVTRKGAISAREGEMGIIPGSMGTCSYIVRGKGNPESFHSASHGAGRKMSRGAAKRKFTTEDLVKQTEGVECRKDFSVLDEIPGAYKDINTVMENQQDLVEIVAELKQVLCVKG